MQRESLVLMYFVLMLKNVLSRYSYYKEDTSHSTINSEVEARQFSFHSFFIHSFIHSWIHVTPVQHLLYNHHPVGNMKVIIKLIIHRGWGEQLFLCLAFISGH